MLQLKKQQLQAEIAGISAKLAEVQKREAAARKRLDAWVALYSDATVSPDRLVTFKGVQTAQGNIAGVAIPIYEGIDVEPVVLDPYRTPAWTDDAQEMLAELMALRAEGDVLARQRELIREELHTTGQRVNLFEKVKIPECKENIRVIRIFNTYGPYMNPDDGRVVSNFICQALRGEDITIYGEGQQTRSFQYIDDLIEGMVRMMENEQGFIGPVNIGNPGEFTIRQLAELVLKKIPTQSKLVQRPLPSDDPTQRKPNISLAAEKLGWAPTIALNEGLDKTIAYFRKAIGMPTE
jgi:H(+)-transporting ATP synthase subunit D